MVFNEPILDIKGYSQKGLLDYVACKARIFMVCQGRFEPIFLTAELSLSEYSINSGS